MTLEQLAGQILMIGVSGDRVTPEMVRLFRKTHAGGLILYRPNFRSAEGLRQMIAGLEEALERRLLVAVDHEGGRVIHLAEAVTVFPDNLALGMAGNETYAAEQGRIEASELRRLGIDLNLAPTVDVLTGEFSPNIGIRSYARDAGLVARLGAARIRAMQEGGLSACAKHFPGQGHSPLDAHLALPVLPTTWEEMRAVHLRPFAEAVKAGVHAVMSSHPVYPNLDASGCPATFSRRIVHDFLRIELGFQGVILSDDLEMGALKEMCSIGESACRAVRAGHDMVLVCHGAQAAEEAYQALLKAYQGKNLDQRELEKSAARIEALKRKRSRRFEEGPLDSEPDGEVLARKIAREAIRVSENHEPVHGRFGQAAGGGSDRSAPANRQGRFPEKKEGTVVIFPRLSELRQLIFVEPEMLDENKFIRDLFAVYGINPAVRVTGLDPADLEIKQALAAAEGKAVIFFCYDAHLFPQTRKLLETLQGTCPRLAVVLLRDPFDADWVKKTAVCVNAFGFRAIQIRAVVERMCGIITKEKVEPCSC